jgi:hypothetical protein
LSFTFLNDSAEIQSLCSLSLFQEFSHMSH